MLGCLPMQRICLGNSVHTPASDTESTSLFRVRLNSDSPSLFKATPSPWTSQRRSADSLDGVKRLHVLCFETAHNCAR